MHSVQFVEHCQSVLDFAAGRSQPETHLGIVLGQRTDGEFLHQFVCAHTALRGDRRQAVSNGIR